MSLSHTSRPSAGIHTEKKMSGEYYSLGRTEMLAFIPPGTRKLIDLGCGQGRFGENVKRSFPNCETWGVEPHEDSAASARLRNDRVISATLDQAALELEPEYGTFDVVTMNDVLEHLNSTEEALGLVRRLLSPTGTLVLSLPNVRYYVNVMDLVLRGKWDYQDFGILDRTHLRFFTFKSAQRKIRSCGFEVVEVKGINRPELRLRHRIFFGVVPRSFRDMQYPQFALIAKPSAEERLY